jgi:hypothetical protein
MPTYIGAIIETRGAPDFWAVAAKHGIQPTPGGPTPPAVPPTLLVECALSLSALGLPAFAQPLSAALGGEVVAVAVQTTGCTAAFVTYQNGVQVRRLEYIADSGGWVTIEGAPQAWEPAAFFDPDGRTDPSQAEAPWPDVLRDELSEADLARYEAARAAGDPSAVLDLIRADSSGPVQRLCRHYGLDPRSPGARARAPRAWAPVAVLVAAIGLWVGAFLLGALTK